MLLTVPYSKTEPPFHFTYQCESNGWAMVLGPIPPFPCHHVTTHDGAPPVVAASARAADDRSAIFRLKVRLVPSSPAEASKMSSAGWLVLATGTTGNGASPAGSLDQFPGGRPWVPLTESVPFPLSEPEPMVTFAGVGSGNRFP